MALRSGHDAINHTQSMVGPSIDVAAKPINFTPSGGEDSEANGSHSERWPAEQTATSSPREISAPNSSYTNGIEIDMVNALEHSIVSTYRSATNRDADLNQSTSTGESGHDVTFESFEKQKPAFADTATALEADLDESVDRSHSMHDVAGGSDTDTSKGDSTERFKDGNSLHIRSNSMKKPLSFKAVSVTKNYLAKTGANALSAAKSMGEKSKFSRINGLSSKQF